MKKKFFVVIAIIVVLVILLTPVRMNLKDGGSVRYKAFAIWLRLFPIRLISGYSSFIPSVFVIGLFNAQPKRYSCILFPDCSTFFLNCSASSSDTLNLICISLLLWDIFMHPFHLRIGKVHCCPTGICYRCFIGIYPNSTYPISPFPQWSNL